jgi:hypothetical protein
MSDFENPCLSLAIARSMRAGAEYFNIWVFKAPLPGANAFHECSWSENLTRTWVGWQEMFVPRGLPHVPFVHHATQRPIAVPFDANMPFTSQLMQRLGISLWEWVFDGQIQQSLAQSQGIAIGQNRPLRLRLEIRDPDLTPLPWEIMQPQPGKPAISLSQQILFSRTTSDVEPLPFQRSAQALNILLVLGKNTDPQLGSAPELKLQQEADTLKKILENQFSVEPLPQNPGIAVPCHVDSLLEPTRSELIDALRTENYNVIFYAGHGIPNPDGGLLFLRSDASINGTELAQVLVLGGVKLAVFNACWGAQPDRENQRAIPRSSLAEVLIHHGVPAVLGMRDSIADEEALSFIQSFAQALRERMSIDRAVAVARQELLTRYKFNQPAWTLPVLYMHPDFDGELIRPIGEGITELPTILPRMTEKVFPGACLRSLDAPGQIWQIKRGRMRVGRHQENDVVIQEKWVSQKHAEIIYRDYDNRHAYFLRDFSRFGTFIFAAEGWQSIYHQEVPLQSGVKLKFGSTQGQTLEFVVE